MTREIYEIKVDFGLNCQLNGKKCAFTSVQFLQPITFPNMVWFFANWVYHLLKTDDEGLQKISYNDLSYTTIQQKNCKNTDRGSYSCRI